MMRGPVRRVLDRFARRIAYEVRVTQMGARQRDLYVPISVLRGRSVRRAAPLGLCELSVFSQNGEDGVISEIFARIGEETKFFVEFGAEDGAECNTRFLADVLGWSGVYFEADDSGVQRLKHRMCHRNDIEVVQALLTADNVNDFFAAAKVPREFDLLSIDIDGQDYWVWRAIVDYRPRVVVIEFNASLPSQARLVEPEGQSVWDETEFFGASLAALEALGEVKGYRLVHTDLRGVNAFFVRADLAERFDPPVRHGPSYRQRPDPLSREYDRVGEASLPQQRVDDTRELG